MSQMMGFTRKETMQLTGCTSSRLAYLEKVGLIIPYRYGTNSGRPTVVFSWEQLLEIRAIRNLRQEDVSLQTVRKIIEFLDQSEYDNRLRNKQLVVVEDEVFWIEQDWSDFGANMPTALKVASKKNKGIGQYVLLVIPPLIDIVKDIWEAAQNSRVIDFQSFKERAKAVPA
ncbi:MerR family transcriptional regulator [Brasilonema octagenarum UFV-E1]|uniref:MerR family transcriptional regulator n=2 Tax=Brasilonema TaxID=383614 RepID=A0A856M8F6_9CYAN|nr:MULTISPECIES: MerR family transcriptional regulator [Brasilonema]NMF64698.1 MerR family transcriptional regulator [Brasilonema octagenarum UFV-OR1]QDL07068.1 MerR family transcriptional regulator [Brasilonema sennae CENA114]QDL13431.1 MerR family transcriptional regulator [Brasilonema octagenarum UFV-E1]